MPARRSRDPTLGTFFGIPQGIHVGSVHYGLVDDATVQNRAWFTGLMKWKTKLAIVHNTYGQLAMHGVGSTKWWAKLSSSPGPQENQVPSFGKGVCKDSGEPCVPLNYSRLPHTISVDRQTCAFDWDANRFWWLLARSTPVLCQPARVASMFKLQRQRTRSTIHQKL